MKRAIAATYHCLTTFGIDPARAVRSAVDLPRYLRDRWTFGRQAPRESQGFRFGLPYPCLGERTSESGLGKGHYFHQDLLVARRVFLNNPQRHLDVGSRFDGFVAHVAAFRHIEVIDIRPQGNGIKNISFRQADFMASLPVELQGYCDSLSCLHALEHFGLGRYGDPVNPAGHLRGLENLQAMLRPGGKLYLSVPIGPQRIEFNAHRVFSVSYMLDHFQGKYRLDQFSFVDDKGDLHEDAMLTDSDSRGSFGCNYGCGIFELSKL